MPRARLTLRHHILPHRRRVRDHRRDELQGSLGADARDAVGVARRRVDRTDVPLRRHHLRGHPRRHLHPAPPPLGPVGRHQPAAVQHRPPDRLRADAALAAGGCVRARVHIGTRLRRRPLHRVLHLHPRARWQLRARAGRRPLPLGAARGARARVHARVAVEAGRAGADPGVQPRARVHRALQRAHFLPLARPTVHRALRQGLRVRLLDPLLPLPRDHADGPATLAT